MFTGLVETIGRIVAAEERGGDLRLVIEAGGLDLGQMRTGASVAVNGACLTAIDIDSSGFAADVSQETLTMTTLGALVPGARVNLEPSLTLAKPLGGHLVSGHVDGVGSLIALESDARSTRMEFEVAPELSRYLARKGSVAVDGTSLTINSTAGRRFSVNIVPHTLENTIMGDYEPGSRVNIEVDLVARYLESLLAERS